MKLKALFLCFFVFCLSGFGQEGFQYMSSRKSISIPFKFINNLIFIPLEINGVPVTFLLDTGVEETILFSLDEKSEIQFSNVEKIKLRGLGNATLIEGLKSSENRIVIRNSIIDKNHVIYIVLDEEFNFSSSIGIPVNGIIGYQFFKNFEVEIDYISNKIIIYNPNKSIFDKKKSKYNQFPIEVINNKPYLTSHFNIGSYTWFGKVLLDIGNSDAFWFFPNQISNFTPSNHSFRDFLGRGFNGDIFGERSRVNELNFEKFCFKNTLIAFPDSLSIQNIKWVPQRIGSLGGEIFKRFYTVFDYKKNSLYLKRNKNYKNEFDFNMSGIEVNHAGLQWVSERQNSTFSAIDVKINEPLNYRDDKIKYKFSLKPMYVIAFVREDSPAAIAGLQKEDIILTINNQDAHNFTLQEINNLLKAESGKSIQFEVNREGKILKYTFKLKSIL